MGSVGQGQANKMFSPNTTMSSEKLIKYTLNITPSTWNFELWSYHHVETDWQQINNFLIYSQHRLQTIICDALQQKVP